MALLSDMKCLEQSYISQRLSQPKIKSQKWSINDHSAMRSTSYLSSFKKTGEIELPKGDRKLSLFEFKKPKLLLRESIDNAEKVSAKSF